MIEERIRPSPGERLRARVFSLIALGAFASGLAYVGQVVHRAATDSFVAPTILTPESDLVLANKVRDAQVAAERAKTAADIEALDADIEAGDAAMAKLRSLARMIGESPQWIARDASTIAAESAAEIRILRRQRARLRAMVVEQHALVTGARASLDANLITKVDVARDVQAEQQLELGLLENERAETRARLQLQQATLAGQSLSGNAPTMPELVTRADQAVHVELEARRLEADGRAKVATRRTLAEKLATLDELHAQLRARPLFRATLKSIDVAFVPYTQLAGVRRGAVVLECTWALFLCHAVGLVAEVVPGEVLLADPWGNQARGQYAILALRDRDAAKARTLRVRAGAATGDTLPPGAEALSER